MRSILACLLLVLNFSLSTSAADWRHPLALDGGDYWRARIPVRIANDSDKLLEGLPVAIAIGQRGPAAALFEIPNAGGRYSSKILPNPEMLLRVRIQVAEAIEELSGQE